MEVGKRLKHKQTENRKIVDLIGELKSELLKMELKIADTKNRV